MESIDQSKLSHRGYIRSHALNTGKCRNVKKRTITDEFSLAGLSAGANDGLEPVSIRRMVSKKMVQMSNAVSPLRSCEWLGLKIALLVD